MGIVRDRISLGGSIDDRDELLQVPLDQGVIQDPVLVFQALRNGQWRASHRTVCETNLEERVLANGCIPRFELIICALTLLIEGIDTVWQTSSEPELFAL